MRSGPAAAPYSLRFLLPAGADGAGAAMTWWPAFDRAALHHARGDTLIAGPSREAVFHGAAAFLRVACLRLGPVSIGGVLMTGPGCHAGMPHGRDAWQISVNAPVSFVPGGLPPVLFS